MSRIVDSKELIQIYPNMFNHNNLIELRKTNSIPFFCIPNKRRYFYNLDSIEQWICELEKSN